MTFFEDGICRAYEAEPSKAMNIECVMVLDRPIERDAFRAVLLARGLAYHRMRSRIVVGHGGRHLFEELDAEAVVDRILHQVSLPDGTWPDLQALLSSQLLAPWRADLPHWEVFIVRGLRRSAELPGDTALFFRLDHALGDGFALKNWLMGFTDEIKAGDLSLHWSSRTHPMPTSESTDHLPQLLAPRASPGASGTPVLSRIAAAGLVVWAVLKMLFFQVVLLLPALWIAVVESELDDTETILKSEAVRHRKSKGSSCLGRVLPCELARKEVRVSSEYSLASIRALAKSLSTPSKRCTVNDVLMGASRVLRQHARVPVQTPAVMPLTLPLDAALLLLMLP